MRKLAVLLTLSVALGCGEAPAPKSIASISASSPAPATKSGTDESAAGAVAERFLRAVLAGDSHSAASLLTAKAVRRHAEDPSTLAAMGLRVERLEVAQALLLDEDEAAVACLITEPGASEPAELCCLLKREAGAWRVCGVASESGDGEPAIISFEGDPEPSDRQLVTDSAGGPAERTAAAPGGQPTR